MCISLYLDGIFCTATLRSRSRVTDLCIDLLHTATVTVTLTVTESILFTAARHAAQPWARTLNFTLVEFYKLLEQSVSPDLDSRFGDLRLGNAQAHKTVIIIEKAEWYLCNLVSFNVHLYVYVYMHSYICVTHSVPLCLCLRLSLFAHVS